MSIATDVSRIKGNITAALAAIADKGVTVPDGSTSDALAELIASIEAGGGGEIDFSPFSSAKFGTFTISGISTKTVTIEGVSSCKVFAMRKVNTGGEYIVNGNHIISTVIVNTDTWESYVGTSLYFYSKASMTSSVKTPTLSGDTLTFTYNLYDTYEYVMVS